MKKHLFNIFTAALLLAGCPLSFADSTCCTAAAATSQANGTVSAALSQISFVSGKANTNADYYIYLYSASWCTPCRKVMPDIVKEYAAIKNSGKVELILVGFDGNEQAVKSYVDKYKAAFPAVWCNTAGVPALPGNKPTRGIPGAVIVDKNGNTIFSGYGGAVLDWKKYTIDRK